MDSEKTQKAAQLMRKELEDIIKNKEELIFYSANLLNQLRRVRKQLRNTKDELMAFQNKQAASCVCFNHKVAPDRVSMCLQEVKNMSVQAKGYKNTVSLPNDVPAQKRAVPNFKHHGKTASAELVDDDNTDEKKEMAASFEPVENDDTDEEKEMAFSTKPKRKSRTQPKEKTTEFEDSEDDEISETFLTSDI